MANNWWQTSGVYTRNSQGRLFIMRNTRRDRMRAKLTAVEGVVRNSPSRFCCRLTQTRDVSNDFNCLKNSKRSYRHLARDV